MVWVEAAAGQFLEQAAKRQRTEEAALGRHQRGRLTNLKSSCRGRKMINPNPKQICLDPSMTHLNPLMIAAVTKEAATRAIAAAEARVTEAEE